MMASQFLSLEREGSNDNKDKYQGYDFYSCSSHEKVFKSEDGKRIVEVFGEIYEGWQDRKEIMKQDIITTLYEEDAEIYFELQWFNSMRGHSSLGPVIAFRIFFAFILLLIVNTVIGMMWLPVEDWWLRLLISVSGGAVLAFVMVFGGLKLKHVTQICVGIARISRRILPKIIKGEWDRKHYHDLFLRLSISSSRDKAKAAMVMARIF